MKLIGLIKYRIGAETKQCRPIDIISIEWEGIARALEVKEAEIAIVLVIDLTIVALQTTLLSSGLELTQRPPGPSS